MYNSGILESHFGDNLRYLRKRDKITLEELSRLLEVSKSSLSDYETRKTYPPLNVCGRLAAYFSISLDVLHSQDLSHAPAMLSTTDESGTAASASPGPDHQEQLNDLGREVKLRSQQVEGLRMQLKLQEQLIDSKKAEIQSLRIQIQLLEEKIKLSSKY